MIPLGTAGAALLRLALALLHRPPDSGSQESVCRTDKPSCGSRTPWIAPASAAAGDASGSLAETARFAKQPADGKTPTIVVDQVLRAATA